MDSNIKTIDSLGRIVIPAYIRKNLNINENTLLEINVLDNKILLSKIDVIEFKNNEVLINILKNFLNTEIAVTNLNKIVASTKKELVEMILSDRFINIVKKRQKCLINGLQMIENKNISENLMIYPILKNSILYGSIVIYLKNIDDFNKNSILLDLIIKLYLETYI